MARALGERAWSLPAGQLAPSGQGSGTNQTEGPIPSHSTRHVRISSMSANGIDVEQ